MLIQAEVAVYFRAEAGSVSPDRPPNNAMTTFRSVRRSAVP
jgi:hypothetical protein